MKIKSIKKIGIYDTYDLKVKDNNNFYLSNFVLSHNSGSGKGKAMGFVNKLFKHSMFSKRVPGKVELLPFVTNKLGRVTPSAMINTYKLDKNNKVIIDKISGKEIIKYGIISQNDFIFSEEARILLEANKDSFEFQEIIMTAVETVGSSNNIYTKTLTDYMETCETRSSASFALTTRPFGKVKQTLVESGLIPRFIFYPRKLDYNNRVEMNKASTLAFKMKSDFNKDFDLMIKEFDNVIQFASDNEIAFDATEIDDLLSFLYQKMMWFTEQVENTVPNDTNRYIMQTFVSRYKNNMVIMAFHSAVMRFSTKVQKQDLQYAFNFFQQLFDAQKVWISLSVDEDKEIKFEDMNIKAEITKILKADSNGITELPILIKELCKKFDKDYSAMRYHVVKFSRGSNPLIKLIGDDGKNQTVELIK
jgi:hypothetical protein